MLICSSKIWKVVGLRIFLQLFTQYIILFLPINTLSVGCSRQPFISEMLGNAWSLIKSAHPQCMYSSMWNLSRLPYWRSRRQVEIKLTVVKLLICFQRTFKCIYFPVHSTIELDGVSEVTSKSDLGRTRFDSKSSRENSLIKMNLIKSTKPSYKSLPKPFPGLYRMGLISDLKIRWSHVVVTSFNLIVFSKNVHVLQVTIAMS